MMESSWSVSVSHRAHAGAARDYSVAAPMTGPCHACLSWAFHLPVTHKARRSRGFTLAVVSLGWHCRRLACMFMYSTHTQTQQRGGREGKGREHASLLSFAFRLFLGWAGARFLAT